MTDEEHADWIRIAVLTLNSAIEAAGDAGLLATVKEGPVYNTLRGREPRDQQFTVTIKRIVNL
jgi:hypothetical protein